MALLRTAGRRARPRRLQHRQLGPRSVRSHGLRHVHELTTRQHSFGHPPDWPVERSQAWAERQHLLVMQCHSYTNACWSISSARCGYDDGVYGMIGCSSTSTIVASVLELTVLGSHHQSGR